MRPLGVNLIALPTRLPMICRSLIQSLAGRPSADSVPVTPKARPRSAVRGSYSSRTSSASARGSMGRSSIGAPSPSLA